MDLRGYEWLSGEGLGVSLYGDGEGEGLDGWIGLVDLYLRSGSQCSCSHTGGVTRERGRCWDLAKCRGSEYLPVPAVLTSPSTPGIIIVIMMMHMFPPIPIVSGSSLFPLPAAFPLPFPLSLPPLSLIPLPLPIPLIPLPSLRHIPPPLLISRPPIPIVHRDLMHLCPGPTMGMTMSVTLTLRWRAAVNPMLLLMGMWNVLIRVRINLALRMVYLALIWVFFPTYERDVSDGLVAVLVDDYLVVAVHIPVVGVLLVRILGVMMRRVNRVVSEVLVWVSFVFEKVVMTVMHLAVVLLASS